jgi:hypothetical protein
MIKSSKTRLKIRRQIVLEYLMSQLESGTKNTKEGKVNLTSKDIKKIQKEIKILEFKIKHNIGDVSYKEALVIVEKNKNTVVVTGNITTV